MESCKNIEHGDGEKNRFDDIPDDILFFAFIDKLVLPKDLSLLSLVCKRFASLVSQAEKLMLHVQQPSRSRWFLVNLFTKISSLLFKSKNLDSLDLLNKFQHLKHLHLKYELGTDHEKSQGLLKWKAVFGSRLEGFLFLQVDSVHEIKDFNELKEDFKLLDIVNCLNMLGKCLREAKLRYMEARSILSENPTLCNIVITDSHQRGKLCMGDEEVAKCRTTPLDKIFEGLNLVHEMEIWFTPFLELQSCVLKEVTLVHIMPNNWTRPTQTMSMEGLDDGQGWEVFGEAVQEMMIKDDKELTGSIPGYMLFAQ